MSVPPASEIDAPESEDRPAIDHPGRSDGFVRGVSELIGGPLGEHATASDNPRAGTGGRFWTATRIVLALTCLMLALHWVQKSPCSDGAWTDNIQYKRFCYSDVLALYYAEGLNEGKVPYRDHAVEYPVLTGAFMGVIGLPIHAYAQRQAQRGAAAVNEGQYFYNATAIALLIFAVATAGMMLGLRRRRPWDVAMFALSPALLVTATVNWDFLAIVLAVGGLWAWARRRPVLAGVLIGLGAAAKLWPIFLLAPLLILGIRARRWAPVHTAAAAVVTCVAVNLPVAYLYYDSWRRFFDLNKERAVDWGTVWYIGNHLPTRGGGTTGVPPFVWLNQHIEQLNWWTYILMFLAGMGVVGVALLAKRPPRVAQLAFLFVAIFLVFNKVWSQQFVLWLVPLAILARPRWGAFLAWQFAEVCYFAAFYGELLGLQLKNVVFPEWVFVLAALLRLGTVITLCGLVIRDIRRPELDPVRQTYAEDPDGGIFNDRPRAPAPPDQAVAEAQPVPA